MVKRFGDKVQINFPRKGTLVEDRHYRLPNTTSLSFNFQSPSVLGRDLLAACNGQIEASTTSACHTQNMNVNCGGGGSPILLASGVSAQRARCTLRLSVGRYTSLEKDVDRAVDILWNAYSNLT